MTENERRLIAAGATFQERRRHRVYYLGGKRVTVHRGGKPNPRESALVRQVIRRAANGGNQ